MSISQASLALVAASALLSSACGGEAGTTLFISEPVPACAPPTSDEPCAPYESGGLPERIAGLGGSLDSESLRRATGLAWIEVQAGEPAFVDLASMHGADADGMASWVVEVVEPSEPRDRILSIASAGGMALWVDETPVLQSRYTARGLNRHSDVASLQLAAGRRTIAYRVLSGGDQWRLYREWWPREEFPDLLARAVEVGAFADLPVTPWLADGDSSLLLKPIRVAAPDGDIRVSFRWKTLLGDVLEEGPTSGAHYPDRLQLPAAWSGAAVLETRVVDGGTSETLYQEDLPVFADSTARRMARELTALPAGADPVRIARQEAVSRAFGLDGDATTGAEAVRVHSLASLHRVVADPQDWSDYPGPQVWGYRDREGAVQPFWLLVPHAIREAASPRPALFAVYHLTDSTFWRGRGAYPGQIIQHATLASATGSFGILPHLGGSHDFADIGAEELPAIVEAIGSRLPIDTTRVGLVVWSQHATSALQIALDRSVPLSRLTLVVPALSAENLEVTAYAVRQARPDLAIDLWSGREDTVVPPAYVDGLTAAFRSQGLEAVHEAVPHSAHLSGLLTDVVGAAYRRLGTSTSTSEGTGAAASR